MGNNDCNLNTRMVIIFCNGCQEWKPRYGYKRGNDETKEWLIEVPQNAGILVLNCITVQHQIQLVNLDLTERLTIKRLFILQFEGVVRLPTDGLRIWGFMCTRQSYKHKIQQNYKKNTSFKHTLYSVCVHVLYDLMGHAGASLRAGLTICIVKEFVLYK